MNEDTQSSSDYKIDKNGRRYPAKKVKVSAKTDDRYKDVSEAAYDGNIGVMELVKFHRTASPSDKKHFVNLMDKKSKSKSEKEQKQLASQIWDHVQTVTNTRLHTMENLELPSFRDLIEGKDSSHALELLAGGDINASLKDGKIHIHDHSQLNRAKTILKRIGSSYEAVKASYDQNKLKLKEESLEEAWEVKKFNKLVKGFLAHKKASKVGGFKSMNFHQYADTVEKALSHPKTSSSSMDEQKIQLVLPKPRDPNHIILAAKKRASGKHRDKKRESKNDIRKHKNDRHTSDFL